MLQSQLMRIFYALLFLLLATSPGQAEDFGIAFWNVENLFDTEDDPDVEGDEEYLPTGAKQWTQVKLDRKLKNLTRLITKMNDQKGPDILGLSEIENRKVVELLVAKLAPLGRKYKIVHRDSPSARGIDCAIIFDEAKFTLIDEKFHPVAGAEQPTRDVVEAELKTPDGATLYFFANHWPSRSHPESDRELAAKVVRSRVDQILKESPAADIVIAGDFNDYPDEPAMKTVIRTVEKPSETVDGALLNTMWPLLRAGKGTYVYNDKWEIIDHIVVSPGLLDAKGFRYKEGSTKASLLVDDQLFDPAGPAIPRPNRSFSKDTFHFNGYSDHLPLEAILTKE